jgi:hypothetical protein
MKAFYDEVYRRFPEVHASVDEGDEELPYLMANYVSDWLRHLKPDELTPEIIQRVIDFSDWCFHQPRGVEASEDILTIWTVAFYEKLFRSETSRRLILHLVTKEELLGNETYLRQWAGAEEFEAVLKLFP